MVRAAMINLEVSDPTCAPDRFVKSIRYILKFCVRNNTGYEEQKQTIKQKVHTIADVRYVTYLGQPTFSIGHRNNFSIYCKIKTKTKWRITSPRKNKKQTKILILSEYNYSSSMCTKGRYQIKQIN